MLSDVNKRLMRNSYDVLIMNGLWALNVSCRTFHFFSAARQLQWLTIEYDLPATEYNQIALNIRTHIVHSRWMLYMDVQVQCTRCEVILIVMFDVSPFGTPRGKQCNWASYKLQNKCIKMYETILKQKSVKTEFFMGNSHEATEKSSIRSWEYGSQISLRWWI